MLTLVIILAVVLFIIAAISTTVAINFYDFIKSMETYQSITHDRIETLFDKAEQCERAIAELNSYINNPLRNQDVEAQKRREQYIQYRHSGLSISESRDKLGVSETTACRYERYMKGNKK